MQDELSARTEGKRLDTIPFAIGFLSVFAFIVSAIAFPEPFIRFMDLLPDKIVKDLGWASVFFSFLVIADILRMGHLFQRFAHVVFLTSRSV